MKNSIRKYYLEHTVLCNALLLFGWFLVNLFQAGFTELTNDEAYYWMYSRNIDYGYFDHPPAIAMLIKAGYLFFHNELGVRFLTVVLGAGFLWLTFLLTNRQNFLLFFGIICSVSSLQVYSFISVPDAPLLFFTAAFFLLYRRYLECEKFIHIFLLGTTIAALLYCKYHGLLVLFFTLLSNLPLLKRKSFYVLIALSAIIYLPHIIWQITNDYPSYQYHVLTKSQDPYNPLDTVTFILGQLLVAGPLIGFLLFYAAFHYRTQNATEKALKYTLFGFMIFFLFSTLNAPVEANWTVAAFVPLVVLGYNYIAKRQHLRKWTIGLSVVSAVIFLFIRINLVFPVIPGSDKTIFKEFHGWKHWSAEIHAKAGNTPVVFANSYQKASKYTFYSGQTALSLNNIQYRRNQFDLWNIENSLQGKRVMYIPNWDVGGQGVRIFHTAKEEVQYVFIDNFRSYAKVAITTPRPRYSFTPRKTVRIPLTLTNQYNHPVTFTQNKNYPDKLVICLFHEEDLAYEELIMPLEGIVLDSTYRTHLDFHVPKEQGIYYMRIAIQTGWLPPAINSRLIRVVVE